MTTATSHGIDVSAHQAPQDWHARRESGCAFAFIKATEGEHTRDQRFSEHMKGAVAAGIPVVGAYHFGWPNEDATAQARNYVTAVHQFAVARRGFVHWLDLEAYGDGRNVRGRSAGEIREWVTDWCTAVRRAFPGQRVGVYAGNAALAAGWVPAGLPIWFPEYPAARCTVAQAVAHARPVPHGHPIAFWQFTSNPLDSSLAYLSAADLVTWAGSAPGAPAPVKKAPPVKKPRVWTVKRGQTLGGIALALGVSVGALASYNHIHNPNVIHPGQHITAPPAPAAKTAPKKGAPTCPR